MDYVASFFVEVIQFIGAANVGEMIADNAPNYKAAGMVIEASIPIFFRLLVRFIA